MGTLNFVSTIRGDESDFTESAPAIVGATDDQSKTLPASPDIGLRSVGVIPMVQSA